MSVTQQMFALGQFEGTRLFERSVVVADNDCRFHTHILLQLAEHPLEDGRILGPHQCASHGHMVTPGIHYPGRW